MMNRRQVGTVLGLLVLTCGQVSRLAAAPKDEIKQFRYETRRIVYHREKRKDPFNALTPLKNILRDKNWRVRIGSLKLSSVIVGRRKVAIFKEMHGPDFSYILVSGVLIGPDHEPISGIVGTIEPLSKQGDYRVVLKQGTDQVVQTISNRDLTDFKTARRMENNTAGAETRTRK